VTAGALRLGLVQVGTPFGAAAANRALSVELAERAFADGAELVVLPELVVSGYGADAAALAEVAEPVDGPTTDAWTEVARHHGGHVCGGICERDGDRLYNSAVLVGPEGIVAHYRKLHLFREEKLAFTPGDRGLPVVMLPGGPTVGICICYDLRFVEVVRALSLKGADVICVPTAWVPGFDARRWDADGYAPQARGALLQANLDQVFLACASQVGTFGELELLGSSIVADPYGACVLGPLSGSEPDVRVVEIDLGAVTRAQTRDPLIAPRADRRTDVYGISVDGATL
jgi:N-carbamoylputrescine amidase